MCNPGHYRSIEHVGGNIWYYDGIRTYYQMAEYLNDPTWGTTCAQYVKNVYRPYVLASNGGVHGWRVFPAACSWTGRKQVIQIRRMP